MITFGLTGGIACGKSTATKTFLANNIPMIDADVVARQVVEPGTPGFDHVISNFGPDYKAADGTLDRTKLGKLVFENKYAMNLLNRIMKPLIQQEADKQIKQAHDAGHDLVGYDAALICEMGNADKYRPLIVVSCPLKTQLDRLMKRNNLTEAEALARINAQMPLEEKIKMADFVLDTSSSIQDSINQTVAIIEKMRAML